MTFLENKWVVIALVALCWAISTSSMTGYYYFQYSDLSAKIRGIIVSANLGINYGNGSTIAWYNGTKINAGATLLDLTKLAVSVNYTESSSGASINAVGGVANSYPKWWMWWSWSSFGWVFGSVACNRYVVGENETLLWYYQDISVYPPPPPH
jgi:hypothetical protein